MAESLHWQFEPRLVHQHLGADKYTSSLSAIGELVANSFQADATRVDVDVTTNDLGAVTRVAVRDNGRGMSLSTLRDRFTVVGVDRERNAGTVGLGKFGVGRLAVFRIGALSQWTSVSDHNGKCVEVSFQLSRSTLAQSRTQQDLTLDVEVRESPSPIQTGTVVEVTAIEPADEPDLTPSRISDALLKQFCSFLLTNQERRLFVCGEVLDAAQMIDSTTQETITGFKKNQTAKLSHLLLKQSTKSQRLTGNLLMCGAGRTVFAEELELPPSDRYLGILECSYLDELVTTNRESIRGLDKPFTLLLREALRRVEVFGAKMRKERGRVFIQKARQEKYYPFRSTSTGVEQVEQVVYDVALETLNDHIRIEGMTGKQKEVVFGLLRRALDNNDLLDVLAEVVKLNDDEVATFKEVLERTTLDAIIHLSAEVADRLTFVAVLHELTYGELSPRLRERSQLHRILEKHCWLFGPQFHLAASDKSFKTIIARHREEAGLQALSEQELASIDDLARIPDLYLAARKDYPSENLRRHLLVELKAPKVAIGRKELDQAKDYGNVLLASGEFDLELTKWDLFLVSSSIHKEVDRERNQKGRARGCAFEDHEGRLRIWVRTWGEIIEAAREELHLIRKHLEQKTQDVKVTEYLREKFSALFDSADSDTE